MEIAWVLCAIAALAAVFFAIQWNGLRQVKAPASNAPALEKRIEEMRAELAQAKEEANKRQKLLEEAREEARKKLRREGKKAERAEEEQKMTGSDPRDIEIQGLKKGLASLESQLNAAKAEVERKTAELERLTGASKGEVEQASSARDEERTRSQSLLEENQALKRTLEDLRAAKRKENERPDVPGTSIDLKSLPAEAVQELARYFRKGEEFERLYAVAQGQVQLSQDRHQELQRRYFAVCRELALAAGAAPGSDDEAKKIAEGAVAGSDQVARSGAATAGVPGVPGAPGDGPKKRRRRRRRRKPGAPGEAGVAAEGADAAAEGADEGGDDEGDDGDEHEAGGESSGESSGGAAPAPASA